MLFKWLVQTQVFQYSQVPNNRPPRLFIFRFFPNPQALLGPLRLLVLGNSLFSNRSIHFLFVSTVYLQFSWQNSVLLYILVLCFMTSCFCSFSLYINSKLFLKFRPTSFGKFRNFFRPPVYLALESTNQELFETFSSFL